MDLKREPKIFLEKADKFDLCNGCASNSNLKALYVGHDNSSIRIILCEECRENLIKVLSENTNHLVEEPREIKHYDIKFSKDKTKCIIYSKHSIISPLSEMREIRKDVEKLKGDKDIQIYFDCLICLGNGSDRFAKAHYYIQTGSIRDFEFVEIPKQDILRKISANYYKDKDFIINNSILTSVQKKMIRKGISI